MMLLQELINYITVQGNIRISEFSGDDEVVLFQRKFCDDLCDGDLNDGLGEKSVTYIFAGEDGYLHIELAGEED